MNVKLLVAGSLVITLLFSGIFFYFINFRRQQLDSLTPNFNVATINLTPEQLAAITPTEKRKINAEGKLYQQILRGTVVSYSPENELVSIITYPTPGNTKEELLEINVDNIEKALCWSENKQTSDEKLISIRDAHISLNQNGNLSLQDEFEKEFETTISSSIGKFVFVNLSTTNELNAKQIAILNCE